MTAPFIAEVRIFPYNFAPRGWAFCDGQLLSIAQNTALFSLVGTTYGGNGTTNFALPNLQGRSPLHPGQGPGLSSYALGQVGGEAGVTLTTSSIPGHTHQARCVNATAGVADPTNSAWALLAGGRTAPKAYSQTAANTTMAPLSAAGGNQPHNNLPPYLTLNFCIALEGIFPSRN